jgi:hypothetical protein
MRDNRESLIKSINCDNFNEIKTRLVFIDNIFTTYTSKIENNTLNVDEFVEKNGLLFEFINQLELEIKNKI